MLNSENGTVPALTLVVWATAAPKMRCVHELALGQKFAIQSCASIHRALHQVVRKTFAQRTVQRWRVLLGSRCGPAAGLAGPCRRKTKLKRLKEVSEEWCAARWSKTSWKTQEPSAEPGAAFSSMQTASSSPGSMFWRSKPFVSVHHFWRSPKGIPLCGVCTTIHQKAK